MDYELLYLDIRKIYIRTRQFSEYIVINYDEKLKILKYIGLFVHRRLEYIEILNLINEMKDLNLQYIIKTGNKKKSRPIIFIHPLINNLSKRKLKKLKFLIKLLIEERDHLFTTLTPFEHPLNESF